MGAPLGGTAGGFVLGLDIPPSGLDVGPRFTGELMFGFNQLSPSLRLDLGARTSFAYHSFDGGGGSMWVWDVVPDVKLIGSVTPTLAFYGDFGAGLAVFHNSVDFGGSDTTLNATFQLGGGASYAISPTVNLIGEIRFDFYTKSGEGTFIAFPSIGLQFH